MIPQIRRKLWPYVYGNKKLFSKSKASAIINSLYPDKKKSFSVLVKEHGTGIKSTLARFKHQGLVIQDPDDLYCLTSFGIWFSISNQLGITFLELCVLACACCVHERYSKNGKQGYYILPFFEEILGKYYAKSHLENVFSILRTNGFGYSNFKKSLIVHPSLQKELMHRYGSHFTSLENWLDGIQQQELDIFSAVLDNNSPVTGVEKQQE